MGCDCDCGQPAVYRPNIQRARKAHTCYECSGPIAPGYGGPASDGEIPF